VSKQLDSTKPGGHTKQQRSKTTPASNSDKNVASPDETVQPDSRSDTKDPKATNPYTMSVRIYVHRARDSESSEGAEGSETSQLGELGATGNAASRAASGVNPQVSSERSSPVRSSVRIRTEQSSAETARKKADTDKKRLSARTGRARGA
jgi:hypothetical protein